jgi:hypothetical protein
MASTHDVFLSHAWGPESPRGSRAYPLKEKALGEEVIKSVQPGQQMVKIFHDELTALLGVPFLQPSARCA